MHQRPIKTGEDFIQTWHIPEGICDAILEYYENNEKLQVPGFCMSDNKSELHPDAKESKDISISPKNMNQPFMDYRIEVQKCLDQFIKIYPHLDNMNKFDILENYNIQHYPKGGGFKLEHCERDGTFSKTIKRCLVFMTYLNDLDDGGTKFIYQNRIVKAQKGKTVIFPSDWTHTHVGQISNTKEKTIVTGWYSYLWDY